MNSININGEEYMITKNSITTSTSTSVKPIIDELRSMTNEEKSKIDKYIKMQNKLHRRNVWRKSNKRR